jgi:parallel beta-helix repeat protein
VKNCSGTIIEENMIFSSNNSVILMNVASTLADTIIRGNTIDGGVYGVHMTGATGTLVKDNFITNHSTDGLHLEGCSGSLIYNNYFANPDGNNAWDDSDGAAAPNSWNAVYDPLGGPNIVDGPCIGGNFWLDYAGVDDGSGQTHPHNIAGDGIGDTELPYNSGGDIITGGDDLPLMFSSDCNENGVPDNIDIDLGTSQDCQPNGVPDECDIVQGTSADDDGDGVPDECANAIPAVSGWGAVTMVLLVLTFGTILLRRQQSAMDQRYAAS